jgi:hypothetical protein
MIHVTTMAEIAGLNARAIRRDAGVQLQDLAKAIRRYGVRWSTSSVGDFESGRTAATLATLYVVTRALSDLVGNRVMLADLFAGIGQVQVNDGGLSVPLTAVRAALGSDEPVVDLDAIVNAGPTADFVETDELVCKRIGMSPEIGAAMMFALWGKTFREERDLRAGSHANAQHRGQVSRELQAELQGYWIAIVKAQPELAATYSVDEVKFQVAQVAGLHIFTVQDGLALLRSISPDTATVSGGLAFLRSAGTAPVGYRGLLDADPELKDHNGND